MSGWWEVLDDTSLGSPLCFTQVHEGQCLRVPPKAGVLELDEMCVKILEGELSLAYLLATVH